MFTGAADVASVPVQVQYDPCQAWLVNVGDGDFLNRDGQTVGHGSSRRRARQITLNRLAPAGSARGERLRASLCVLTFQAKAPGRAAFNITRAGAINSAQQTVAGQTSRSHHL